MHRFERRTQLGQSAAVAFAQSLNVDFHTESFADSGEQAVDGILTGELKEGETVTWRARHFGIWWRMTSLISAYEPPTFFVDEQVSGPFKSFRHEHHFTDNADGCMMRDVIEMQAPLGPLGWLAQKIIVNRYLEGLIDLRNAELQAALGSGEGTL